MDSHHMDIIRRMASALLRQPSPSRSCLATSRRFATLDSWPVATSHDRLWQARAGYDRRQATTLRPCSGNDVLTWNDTNTMTHWWCTVCSAKRWCILRGGNDVREIWIFLMYHVLHDVCNTMQLWQNLPGETGLPVLHPGHYAASQWKGRQSTIPPNQHKSLWSSDPHAELCKTVHHHIGSVFFPVPDLSQLVDVGSLHFTLLCCASTQHLFRAGVAAIKLYSIRKISILSRNVPFQNLHCLCVSPHTFWFFPGNNSSQLSDLPALSWGPGGLNEN